MIRRSIGRRSAESDAQRWTVSYSDFVTLLLAFFASLYSLEVQKPEPPPVVVEVEPAPAPKPQPEPVIIACDEPIGFSGPPMPQRDPPPPLTPEELLLDEVVRALVRDPALEGRIQLDPDPRGVRLSLGTSVLFKPGKDKVLDSALETIAKLGVALGRLEGSVTVEGHTDNLPVLTWAFRSNWELSSARATEVLLQLVEVHGIDPARLSAAGYGQYRPIASNDTREGRALNRRIDVVVAPTRQSP